MVSGRYFCSGVTGESEPHWPLSVKEVFITNINNLKLTFH